MTKKYFSILFISMCLTLSSQEYALEPGVVPRQEPYIGDITIPVIFATFSDAQFQNVTMEIDSTQTLDEGQLYPVMFSMPDGQSAHDYITANGSYSYFTYLEDAILEFYSDMTKGSLNITLDIIENPERPDGLWVIGSLYSYKYTERDGLKEMAEDMKAVVNDYYYDNGISDDFLGQYSDLSYFIKGFNNKIATGFCENHESFPDNRHRYTIVQFNEKFNIAVDTYSHELGHLLCTIRDIYQGWYNGFWGEDKLGFARSFNSAYDKMSMGGYAGSPYVKYGIKPFHTSQLIHQGYLDSVDFALANEENEDIYFTNNKMTQRIKAVREILNGDDVSNDVKNGIILPVTVDKLEDNEYLNINVLHERTNTMVEKQQFLIEYRNGRGFDEISSYGLQGESKGILISHMLNYERWESYIYNGNTIYPEQYVLYNPLIDIESATPYPENYRDPEWNVAYPDSTGTYVPIPVYCDGMFYNGRDVNDWMDDLLPNIYDPEGGRKAWWRDSTAINDGSLPTDFFNDTDRNKFTPSTRPSSNSWKQKNLHLGVYIDKIEGDYADISVYKNYWSRPLLSRNKLEADKSDFYEFEGYGYFGEKFYIEENVTLELYAGANYTLVPETDMHLLPNSKLKIPYGSQLTFDENAKLTLEKNSSVDIMQDVMVDAYQNELHEMSYFYLENGSNLKMFDGSKINGNLEVYCSGTTEIQENSIVHLDDKAKFILQNGGKLKLLVGSTLIIHEISDLVLEDGAVIEVYEGSEIILEKGGQIHTNGIYIGNTKIVLRYFWN